MTERTLEEVLERIDPLLDDIYGTMHAALATYLQTPPELLIDHDTSTAAHVMWCHMQAEAERRFLKFPRIVLKTIRGMKVWIIEDFAVMRLKKLDEEGRSSNYRTAQQDEFDRGDELPGLPPAASRVVAGYVLDKVGRNIDWVLIARPSSGALPRWCVAVNEPGQPLRYEVKYRAFG
jgi:hypothetical protein